MLITEPSHGIPAPIASPLQFEEALDKISRQSGPIATDLERAQGYRYSHKPYLLQIKRGDNEIFLFDVPELEKFNVDFSRLIDIAPTEEWILHDASQDLNNLDYLHIHPYRLFDTEFAARFLNLPHVGLSACTEYYLDKSLAKEYSLVDWSQRPLLRSWRNYAALDVELLFPLRQAIAADLENHNKLHWAYQEFDRILKQGLQKSKPSPEPWRHLSHITSLGGDRRSLAIARQLWITRDTWAQNLDIEPSLLLQDKTIINTALRKPHNRQQFRQIPELYRRVRLQSTKEREKMYEKYASLQRAIKPRIWEKAVLIALNLHDNQLPTPAAPSHRSQSSTPRSLKKWRLHQPHRYERLLQMRAILESLSDELDIPEDLLLKPADIRDFCWSEVPLSDMEDFFANRQARSWQLEIVLPSVKSGMIRTMR